MQEKEVRVENKTGIHARPAAMFVQAAGKFKSKVEVRAKERNKKVDAKSILMVMSLGLIKGTDIIISAQGEDEEEAVDTLCQLIKVKFGEE